MAKIRAARDSSFKEMIFFFFIAALFQQPQETAPPKPMLKKLEGVAAIVNNEVITESELQMRLEPARKSFGFQDPAEWERYSREILVRLVHEKLLAQAARRAPLDQEQVEEELKKRLQEAEKAAGGKANLMEKLQQLGSTYEEFVNERRNEILSRNLYLYERGIIPGASGRVNTDIYVTPEEIRQYYRSHEREFFETEAAKGRQIFISIDPSDPDKTKKRVQEVEEKLAQGVTFPELAKTYSDWKAQEGGALGWVDREGSSFEKPIVSFLFSNPPGTVSAPIALRRGYAIVQLESQRPKRQKSFEEVQLEILRKIYQERNDAIRDALHSRLLREAYVWPPDLMPR